MSVPFIPITEEKDFLLRLNTKSEEAFHELFRQFYSYLVIFAERRLDNPKVAEDIVQEGFRNLAKPKTILFAFGPESLSL